MSFAFICRICIAVVSILPACASFLMALVTFLVVQVPAIYPIQLVGEPLPEVERDVAFAHQEALDFGPLGSLGSENI